jgi:hypothetical protein
MRRAPRFLSAGLVLAAALLLGLPAGARAQFRYGYAPAAGYAYARTQAAVNTAFAAGAGFGYSPWGWGYGYPATWGYGNSVGGFLDGSADVMAAAGQYEVSHQQANLTREQVKSAHIDNRRKMFDELRYERENTPPLSAELEAFRREQLAQTRGGAQLSEIWSAAALNVLLDDIRLIQRQTGLEGAVVPLDPDAVKHISLTTGSNTGSSSMLNNGGKLKWPPELDDERFNATRKNIDRLFQQATQEAAGPDGLSGRTMRELSVALDGLQQEIGAAVDAMTPSDNVRAQSYAAQLEKTAKMLRDPGVANQLNGKWAPRGNTVGELVANMDRDGLKFGPAAPDGKPYYSSLYQSLVRYDSSLQAMVSATLKSPGRRP